MTDAARTVVSQLCCESSALLLRCVCVCVCGSDILPKYMYVVTLIDSHTLTNTHTLSHALPPHTLTPPAYLNNLDDISRAQEGRIKLNVTFAGCQGDDRLLHSSCAQEGALYHVYTGGTCHTFNLGEGEEEGGGGRFNWRSRRE